MELAAGGSGKAIGRMPDIHAGEKSDARVVPMRMHARLKAIRQALMRRIHEPIPRVGRWLRRVVQGYFNDHAVPGNVGRLDALGKEVSRAWLHALRRRGQRGRMPWSRFARLVDRHLPRARVLHPYLHQRFAS